jgi:fructokinase
MTLTIGVDVGGTKVAAGVVDSRGKILEKLKRPTPAASPAQTAHVISATVLDLMSRHKVDAVGLGAAGFVEETRATVLFAPNLAWRDEPVKQQVQDQVGVPVIVENDANATAWAEAVYGAARGHSDVVLITVGTGIGGGGMAGGNLLHGLLHPEFGHMRIPHDLAADPFPGVCPYHGDCWEGLASGRAIEARWGRPAASLDSDQAVWELEARYLALGLVSVMCVLSPERIVIGGGVAHHQGLLDLVRREVLALMNGYLEASAVREDIADYITLPGLGLRAGVLGAIALAETL